MREMREFREERGNKLNSQTQTQKDYIEGVKTKVLQQNQPSISSSSSPNWRSLSEIGREEISELFVPLEGDREKTLLDGVRVSHRRPPIKELFPALLQYESTLYTTVQTRRGQPTLLPAEDIAHRFLPPGVPVPKMDSLIDQALGTSNKQPTTTEEENQQQKQQLQQQQYQGIDETLYGRGIIKARKRLVERMRGIARPTSHEPLTWEDRY
jgi:hypothetical protein